MKTILLITFILIQVGTLYAQEFQYAQLTQTVYEDTQGHYGIMLSSGGDQQLKSTDPVGPWP